MGNCQIIYTQCQVSTGKFNIHCPTVTGKLRRPLKWKSLENPRPLKSNDFCLFVRRGFLCVYVCVEGWEGRREDFI